MGKEKNATARALMLRELFQVRIYKRSQGRIARQVTVGAIFVVLLLVAYRLYELFERLQLSDATTFGLPPLLFFAGAWISYRLVNMPTFADFLIAVEAEMNKVSWPSKGELWRALLVVLFSIFFLVLVLWAFDMIWWVLLHIVLRVT
jgi:preprotein translocase subunit SecE